MGNTNVKTYFDLLPSDLKHILLLFDPSTALILCKSVIALKRTCSDSKYWTKLYHEEFSIYQAADFEKYFNSRLEYDNSFADLHDDPRFLSNRKGWERKFIPLIEDNPYLFRNNNFDDTGHKLLRSAMNKGHLHIVKYLVENKAGNISSYIDMYNYFIASNNDIRTLAYFMTKGVIDEQYLNQLLKTAISLNNAYDRDKRRNFIKFILSHGADARQLNMYELRQLKAILG